MGIPQANDAESLTTGQMSYQGDSRGVGNNDTAYGSAHESGSRRRRFAGYLKAANELRQSYQQSYGLGGQNDGEADENGSGIPGSFPDLAIVRNGDEEMVLFPSYARQHHAKKGRPLELPGSQDIRTRKSDSPEDSKKEWENYEESSSIVDVDVRGWVYSPHRGAMTRKNRVLVGLARHLSGIPAPSGGSRSRTSSPPATHYERVEARAARQDEELVEKEAESILKRGENEAIIARQGGYSENPAGVNDKFGQHSSSSQGRTPSPGRIDLTSRKSTLTKSSLHDSQDDTPGPGFLAKRASWNHPSDMSPAELSAANAHLMARLKPFLTTPIASTPLTIFFYNQDRSKSRTVMTDESGHFNIRVALDFVPTNVRVLASDKLSATEEVRITEPTGVSVISDIDDTIKHSAIGSGAKEIFRNTFIRELGDLHIEGVKEWYGKMADLGVTFHYVSNSPWQLYPVLVTFFAGAGLPKGSFHLKQYSGMLQGIFEPVAERKKGTLDKIMRDFPERRFILVGDSGEADLELYTDLVLANPRRILGVFIRDVTTTRYQGFFDSSIGAANNGHGAHSPFQGRQNGGGSVSHSKSASSLEVRPTLPPRQQTRSTSTLRSDSSGPVMGKLIDFDEEPSPRIHRSMTDSYTKPDSVQGRSFTSKPPSRPSKPLSLQSHSGETLPSTSSNDNTRKAPPPPPPKPRKYSTSQDSTQPVEPSPLSQAQTASPSSSRAPSLEPQSYRSAVRNKVANAYNALPAWNAPQAQQPSSQPRLPPDHSQGQRSNAASGSSTADSNKSSKNSLPPPLPPRRALSSYPAAAAQYATNRLSGSWSGYNSADTTTEDANANPAVPALNKKEDLWNRRWARAKEIFEQKGVLLRSWRSGEDVLRDAVRLVEKAKTGDKEPRDNEFGERNEGNGR